MPATAVYEKTIAVTPSGRQLQLRSPGEAPARLRGPGVYLVAHMVRTPGGRLVEVYLVENGRMSKLAEVRLSRELLDLGEKLLRELGFPLGAVAGLLRRLQRFMQGWME